MFSHIVNILGLCIWTLRVDVNNNKHVKDGVLKFNTVQKLFYWLLQ